MSRPPKTMTLLDLDDMVTTGTINRRTVLIEKTSVWYNPELIRPALNAYKMFNKHKMFNNINFMNLLASILQKSLFYID